MAYLVPQQLVELLWSVPFPSGPVPGRRPSVLTRRGPGAGRQRDADTPRPMIGFPVAAKRTARRPRDTWPRASSVWFESEVEWNDSLIEFIEWENEMAPYLYLEGRSVVGRTRINRLLFR